MPDKDGDHYVDLMKESNYLRTADLRGKDVTVEIIGYDKNHEFTGDKGRVEIVKTLTVTGGKSNKLWVMNNTIPGELALLFGDTKIANWVGRRVTLYPDPDVMFGKKRTGGIRVRKKLPAQKK